MHLILFFLTSLLFVQPSMAKGSDPDSNPESAEKARRAPLRHIRRREDLDFQRGLEGHKVSAEVWEVTEDDFFADPCDTPPPSKFCLFVSYVGKTGKMVWRKIVSAATPEILKICGEKKLQPVLAIFEEAERHQSKGRAIGSNSTSAKAARRIERIGDHLLPQGGVKY